MKKLVPGPWKVIVAGNQWGVTPVTKSGKPRNGRETEDICGGNTLTDMDWKAHAQAIASLPDMAAAAEIASDYLARAQTTHSGATGETAISLALPPYDLDRLRDALKQLGVKLS